MTHDPIIEALHETRARLAAECNYDVYAIVAQARAAQEQENHPIVSFSAKRIEPEDEALLPEKQAA
jgi:hypothetical protein